MGIFPARFDAPVKSSVQKIARHKVQELPLVLGMGLSRLLLWVGGKLKNASQKTRIHFVDSIGRDSHDDGQRFVRKLRLLQI